MNWNARYTLTKTCSFCNGPSHLLKTARNWTEENAWDEDTQRPSMPTGPLFEPVGEHGQDNWRIRVPIPGNSYPHPDTIDSEGRLRGAPAPHPERDALVKTENRCPMCMKKHNDSDNVVRFTGMHGSVDSDHYPFHEKCMRNTTLFCPHMMEYGDDFKRFVGGETGLDFERGSYGDLRVNADKQTSEKDERVRKFMQGLRNINI